MLCIIQARSNSKRFKNKVLHLIHGVPLIQHVINKISKYFSDILIVSNDSKLVLEDPNIKIIKDCRDGYLGPLVGVLSAMKYANQNNKYNWVITFPCDTPFFDEIIVEKMIQKTASKSEKIFLIKEKKQRHNIFGIWSTSLEKILEQDINNNFRKVQLWVDKIGCSYIEKDIKNENEFLNINTKKDLELAERIYNKK